MANIISDKLIAYASALAELELSEEEKKQAARDMGQMLDYMDQLNELDTSAAEPMYHAFYAHAHIRNMVAYSDMRAARRVGENLPCSIAQGRVRDIAALQHAPHATSREYLPCSIREGVFREDTVTNGDGSKETLANAPSSTKNGIIVPKTIGSEGEE